MANKLTKSLLAAAIAVTGAFEGVRNTAYQDGGNVWTICYGSTLGVRAGDTKTHEQCRELFEKDLATHNTPLEAIPQQLPPNVHLASLDLAYNIGVNAFGRSTLYEYLLNADYPNACMEIPRWRYVAGRDCANPASNCQGIVTRREVTSQLCLGQISINDALFRLGQLPLDKEVIDAIEQG